MDPDKLALLFGKNVPPGLDLDDQDQLLAALKKTSRVPLDELELTLREIIARQILDGVPPLVWETVQRLQSGRVARHKVMDQLSRALAPVVGALMDGDSEDFEERYATNLRALPLASEMDVERVVKVLLAGNERPSYEDLSDRILGELGVTEQNDAVNELIEAALDRMLEYGEIELLAGDIVVDPEQLCRGIVLTTRVTAEAARPPMATDLAGLSYLTDDVAEPSLDRNLVDAIQRAYAAETAENALPISFRELTLRLLAEDPATFDEPQLPLSELVTAAGLEIRGDLIADGPVAWRQLAHSRATFRIIDRTSNDEERRDVVNVYGLFERMDPGEPEITSAELRRALDVMADESVLQIATDQFFGYDEDPESLDAADAFARRLSAAASKPMQRAVAAVFTAMVAERRCDPLAAADALAEAVHHARDFFPAVDRLAWTRSDQGRASEAKSLWLQVVSPDDPDLEAIEKATAGQGNPGAGMRRNEPCWCGSGRKYKVCHLRANELPPLPDRFTWLLRKNVGYVERRGAPLDRVVAETAWKLADGDPEKLSGALQDPLVMDLVLYELGWFDRFLAERGALLPEDEQLLYASWQLIPRTVYEVIGVTAGTGLKLRDLRTVELTDVQERTLSRTASVGQLICARALPVGRGHQLVGAVLSVPPGHEDAFLDAVDEPDPVSVANRLLDYMAAASRPPELRTSTGEPLRVCTLVLSVDGPDEVRSILDRRYVSVSPDRWYQKGANPAGNLILASLELSGSTLTVETMSEYRMDEITDELEHFLPDASTVSRTIEQIEDVAARKGDEPTSREPVAAEAKAALAEWLGQREERWCSESVPALGGLTPREAADDPTQRERVIRLIDSFPPGGGATDEGSATMRPDRLRELLGIR